MNLKGNDEMTSNKRKVLQEPTCGHDANTILHILKSNCTKDDVVPIQKWDEKYFPAQFDYKHMLPRTNIIISMVHGNGGGFYLKCVLYDCLLYNSCYLFAWLELCFISGLDSQMVHVEIPLCTDDLPSSHILCLLLRLVKHGPYVALCESVQYTFGQKKFLYYYSSGSLHMVLNSSCYVMLLEEACVRQELSEGVYSLHFNSDRACEVVSNFALNTSQNYQLPQQQQEQQQPENETLSRGNQQTPDQTDNKSSNRKRALLYRNQNSDRKLLTGDLSNYSNLSGIIKFEFYFQETILESCLRCASNLLQQVCGQISHINAKFSSEISIEALATELVTDSLATLGQLLTAVESNGSALDALLSAFLVALLSRLAQLRRELAEEEGALLSHQKESKNALVVLESFPESLRSKYAQNFVCVRFIQFLHRTLSCLQLKILGVHQVKKYTHLEILKYQIMFRMIFKDCIGLWFLFVKTINKNKQHYEVDRVENIYSRFENVLFNTTTQRQLYFLNWELRLL